MSKDAFAILLSLAGLAGIYAVITGRVTITNGALAFNFGTPGAGLSVNRGSGTNNGTNNSSGYTGPATGSFGSYANATGTAGAVLAIAPPAMTLTLPTLPQLDNVNALA